jgi:protein N-terminal amidase
LVPGINPSPFDISKWGLTHHHIDTGYVFHGPEDVRPFAEQPRTGPTSTFVSELAARLRCHVMAGYPEALPAEEDPRYGAYNSAVIFGPSGQYIGGSRKTNLYVADLPWCKPGAPLYQTIDFSTDISPGTGFAHFELPFSSLRSISLGICNDLGPRPPNKDPSSFCELAEFAIQKNARMLVVLCAWLHSGHSPDSHWDMENIDYWVTRVRPLWERPGTSVNHARPDTRKPSEAAEDRETVVVICNRTGIERGE